MWPVGGPCLSGDFKAYGVSHKILNLHNFAIIIHEVLFRVDTPKIALQRPDEPLVKSSPERFPVDLPFVDALDASIGLPWDSLGRI